MLLVLYLSQENYIYIYIYIYIYMCVCVRVCECVCLPAHTQKKKLLNELKKIRVNFSTKFNYIFPPKSNLFEISCCNLVV